MYDVTSGPANCFLWLDTSTLCLTNTGGVNWEHMPPAPPLVAMQTPLAWWVA